VKKGLIVRLAILGVVVVFFLVAYFAILSFFQDSTTKRGDYFAVLNGVPQGSSDYMAITGAVTEIDPLKRELKIRLDFSPEGSLALTNSFAPGTDFKLIINNIAAKEFTLKKGELISAIDISLPLSAGLNENRDPKKPLTAAEKQRIVEAQPSSYPYDKYFSGLVIYVVEVPKDGESVNLVEPNGFPLYFTLINQLPNYKLEIVREGKTAAERTEETQLQDALAEKGAILLPLQVERSVNIIFYFWFVMIIMALISLTAFGVALTAALFPHTFEIGTRLDYDIFAYMAALLFAFPALRETMPETPRLGAFGDFLVFFWAEGLIAVSLVIAVITWLVRRYTRHRQVLVQEAEAKAEVASVG
jgi:Domain of unknown function (DUF4436)